MCKNTRKKQNLKINRVGKPRNWNRKIDVHKFQYTKIVIYVWQKKEHG